MLGGIGALCEVRNQIDYFGDRPVPTPLVCREIVCASLHGFPMSEVLATISHNIYIHSDSWSNDANIYKVNAGSEVAQQVAWLLLFDLPR